MFQNLKVDIIYYRTNTDFEMEFNLCGCCRMRLLTDKSPDRKTALHSLARAVSRSRIIIVTGGLFGDDGIISLVAKAIESKLEAVDNKAYGIVGNEPIEILKGATPLVTADGYFGGCIIESGPQTMILLSENKNIRKTVMQTLVHPYVEQLCAMELNEKAAAATDNSKPTVQGAVGGNAGPLSEDDTPHTLAEEYGIIATELFTEPEAITESVTDTVEKLENNEESGLLVEDEASENDPLSLDDEYEKVASALFTAQEESTEKEDAIDTEIEDGVDSPLLTESDELNQLFTLDEEYENMASSLFTEQEEAVEVKNKIDDELEEGVDSPLLMESDESDDMLALDKEYEIVADALYTESNTEADFNRDPNDISLTTKAEADALISGGMILEGDDEDSFIDAMSPDSEINTRKFSSGENKKYTGRPHFPLSLNAFILIVTAVLLIALAILCYCIFYVPSSNGMDAAEYISETFNTLFGKS